MKLTCERASLLEAVSLAGSLASARAAKPILQSLKLVAGDGYLDVLGTDLEVGVRYRVENVEVETVGETAINASRMLGIVRESSDDKVRMELVDRKCIIRYSDSEFDLPSDDPAEFPQIPEFTKEGQVEIDRADLTDMIGRTLFAAATESSRYALNGVYFAFGNNKMELVATDGRRLAHIERKAKGAKAEMQSLIVPAKALGQLQRLPARGEAQAPEEGQDEKAPKKSKGKKGAGDKVMMSVEENQVRFQSGPVLVVSQLVEGRFPPYRDVIPKDCNKKVTLDRQAFLGAVRRAALLTTEEARSVKLAFASQMLTLTSQAPEAGQATVQLGVQYEGEPLEIAFNPKFLEDVLKVMTESEVVMEMSDKSRPAMLKSDADYVYVVMPIHVLE